MPKRTQAEVEAASGLTVDEDGTMWISSTYGNMIVACDSKTGKTIGIQLGDNSQSKYTPLTGTPSSYYGMMDAVTFSSSLVAGLDSFTSDKEVVDGAPVTLTWNLINPGAAGTLTLDDGTGAVNVLPLTDTESGYGSTAVNPTANTTYTLTLDGTLKVTATQPATGLSKDLIIDNALSHFQADERGRAEARRTSANR